MSCKGICNLDLLLLLLKLLTHPLFFPETFCNTYVEAILEWNFPFFLPRLNMVTFSISRFVPHIMLLKKFNWFWSFSFPIGEYVLSFDLEENMSDLNIDWTSKTLSLNGLIQEIYIHISKSPLQWRLFFKLALLQNKQSCQHFARCSGRISSFHPISL